MEQKDLRTYKRRKVTRTSGFQTNGENTGGECILLDAYKLKNVCDSIKFNFKRENLELVELFGCGNGMFAFGGYIKAHQDIKVNFKCFYTLSDKKTRYNQDFSFEKSFLAPINTDCWSPIGFHKEVSLDMASLISNIEIEMEVEIKNQKVTDLKFIGFDLDIVSKKEYIATDLKLQFSQKTSMHIPHIYYLNAEKPFTKYLQQSYYPFSNKSKVVLKSCNRCGRYLPIDIKNEVNTLAFSLHCKKKAPCKHSTFSSYEIKNNNQDAKVHLIKYIEDNKIKSYYGHQLECKACKKFFVNAPLNPQRTPQQYKEDGLRRRAIEVLVNTLLEKNIVHFEFEKKTKEQFSQHIWKKFDERCFKCGKKIKFDEMHLDHTMPLAYLYRLDETATCLCASHNSQKRDSFPIDFYTTDELIRLSEITGLDIDKLKCKGINQNVLDLLVKNIIWFYEDFLMNPEYQKKRDGILTADKINDSLKRVIGGSVDLAEEYKIISGKYPSSITIQ